MPPLHRYLGNPVLSWLGRTLFGLKNVKDFHCGIRGFNVQRIQALGLCMPGMEFASELVVRASLAGYSLVEVPTTLAKDGRSRPPHLRTWRDGWRHLRFLLVFAPRKTLVLPGFALAALGLLGTAVLSFGTLHLGAVGLDVNAMVYTCLLMIVGAQLVLFGGFAEIYGWHEGIVRHHQVARWTRLLRLERLVAVGLVLIVAGLVGTVVAFTQWGTHNFGSLSQTSTIRVVLVSATAIALGAMGVFAGFFTSLLTLRSTRLHATAGQAEDEELVGI